MTAQISRLPGINCVFYAEGGCFYEEHINPGDNEDWHCSEIKRILKKYDDFVERADKFSLQDEQASQLWEAYEENMPALGTLCSSYRPNPCKQCGEDGQITDCEFELALVCVLKLPVCAGVCRRYRHSRTSEAAEGCPR